MHFPQMQSPCKKILFYYTFLFNFYYLSYLSNALNNLHYCSFSYIHQIVYWFWDQNINLIKMFFIVETTVDAQGIQVSLDFILH
jgi:hypothetical protein